MKRTAAAHPFGRRRGGALRWRRPALAALGAGLALAAGAQTKEEPVDKVDVTDRRSEGYTVKELSSATGLPLSPRETPQSMTVMTRERMDDQNLNSLRSVLDNTPGIYSNAYDTERVLFWSRGFLVDTLMYDGVPAVYNFNTSSIAEQIDSAPYERIEIVRGATGLLTGTGNPGASVNLVRKHADSRTPTATLDLSIGSWKNLRGVIDATTPLNADGTIRARVVAVGETTESYQDLYNKDMYVGYAIIDADLSPATRVSLGFDYQDNRPRANTWGSFPMFLSNGQRTDWPTSVTTATDWAYWFRKTQTTFAELQHNFDNGWTLKGSLSYRRFSEQSQLFYMYGFPDPATGLGLDGYAYKDQSVTTQSELDVQAVGPFELGGRQHQLVVGVNASRSKLDQSAQDPLGTDPNTGALQPPPGNFFQWDGSYPKPAFGPSYLVADTTLNQEAVYAAARFSVADPLKLIVGARYASWRVDSFYLYESPNDTNLNLSKVIPYAGVVWDFLPQFSAFASYTSIFKPQSERDVNGHYLDPIDGVSYEIGIKGEHFDRRLNTALTLFETRQDNIAAVVLDPSGNPVLRPDGSNAYAALDGVRSRGFELEANGRVTNDVQLSFGWTYFAMHDDNGDGVHTFLPRTLVRLFGTWQPRQWVPDLTLGAGFNWQSGTSSTIASPSGTYRLTQGGFGQLSLMARYQFTPQVAVQFNAQNVLDKKFYVLDEYDNTYFGAPANYTLSMRMTF